MRDRLLTRSSKSTYKHGAGASLHRVPLALIILTALLPNQVLAQAGSDNAKPQAAQEATTRLQSLKERLLREQESQLRPRSNPVSRLSSTSKFEDPQVQISAEDACQFDRAFLSLSKQAHIAILSEGVPLTPSLEDDARVKLLNALHELGDRPMFNQTIDAVAAAYDYEPARIDAHTLLLFKKFSNSKDLPFVTADEVEQDMHATLRFLRQYIPDLVDSQSPNCPVIGILVRAHAQFGTALATGVPFTSFSTDDQLTILSYSDRSYAIEGTYGPADVLLGLKAMRSPDSHFLRMDLMDTGVKIFGFEGPFSMLGDHREFPLSHGFHIQSGGVSAATTDQGNHLYLGEITQPVDDLRVRAQIRAQVIGHLPDPDTPKIADYVPQTPLPTTFTLSELTARVAARPDAEGLHLTCETAVAPKTVNCFNETLLSPESVLRAAAEVYGLHVRHPSEKSWILTTPPESTVGNAADIPAVVEQLFPEPWRRAFVNGAHLQEEKMLKDAKSPIMRNSSTFHSPDLYGIRHANAPMAARDAIYREAVHQLRVLIEPKLKDAPGGIYTMKQMTEEERRLLILVWSAEFFKMMDDFMRRYAPSCFDHPEMAFVVGNLGDNPMGKSILSIGKRNARGLIDQEASVVMPTPLEFQHPYVDPNDRRHLQRPLLTP